MVFWIFVWMVGGCEMTKRWGLVLPIQVVDAESSILEFGYTKTALIAESHKRVARSVPKIAKLRFFFSILCASIDDKLRFFCL